MQTIDPADLQQLQHVYDNYGYVSPDDTSYHLEFFEARGDKHESALKLLRRVGVTAEIDEDNIIKFPRLPELGFDEEF